MMADDVKIGSKSRIWERAVTLDDAWLRFADPEQSRLFELMPDGMTAFAGSAKDASAPIDLFKAAHEGMKARQNRDTLIADLRSELLDNLFNENLAAVAYRLKPSTSRTPVTIKSDFFEDPQIDWGKNSAEALGKRYEAIRIYDPYALPSSAKVKVGKIGSADAINSVIDNLLNHNSEFCNLPRKIACSQIREILKKDNFYGNGLSDVNLSKYILRKCPVRRIE